MSHTTKPFSITTQQLVIFIAILLVIRIIAYFIVKNRPESNKFFFSEKIDAEIYEYIDSIVIAGIAALIIITYIIRPFYIPSESMVPTLKVNDYIIVNEFIYRFKKPQRGDVIVFHPPKSANADDKEYIKRIIAVAGDTIEVKNGKVILNGAVQNEPYINAPCDYNMSEFTVPEGNLFMLGDNRPNSGDSHIWGPLPVKNIVGKAVAIIWPIIPRRIGIIK